MRNAKLFRSTLFTLVAMGFFHLPPVYSSDLPLESDLVIPIVSRTPGVNGTVWKTRVELLNPDGGTSIEDVRLCFWPSSQSILNPSCVDDTLLSFEEKVWHDVLLDVFGIEDGSGFLTISGRVFAHAEIFNEGGVSGTYGQFVPSVPPIWSFPLGPETQYPVETSGAYFPSVVESEGHRTNLGIVNLSERAVKFILYFWEFPHLTPDGREIVVVPPQSVVQLNRVLSDYCHGATYCDAMVTVGLREVPGGRFLTYISRVDNQTGDAVFIPGHSNLLALVPPKPSDQTFGGQPDDPPAPNLAIPADHDPRKRGSSPLNSDR